MDDEMTVALDLYRQMAPVKQVLALLSKNSQWMSTDFQNRVLNHIIYNPICDKFSPSFKYIERFFKCYIEEIEKHNYEIVEGILLEFLQLSQRRKDIFLTESFEDFYHLSFHLPRMPVDDVVVCRVAGTFNEVGLKIWEAAYVLAEFGLANKNLFKNKRIVEFGSGVGFTGLMLAKYTNPQYILLTDYAPEVMQNLRYNIEINSNNIPSDIVDSSVLDWELWKKEDAAKIDADVLLAGDCVYDIEVIPFLINALKAFFLNDQEDMFGNRRVAFFATTVRNMNTFTTFLEQIEQSGIVADDITDNSKLEMPNIFSCDNRDSIKLHKLYIGKV